MDEAEIRALMDQYLAAYAAHEAADTARVEFEQQPTPQLERQYEAFGDYETDQGTVDQWEVDSDRLSDEATQAWKDKEYIAGQLMERLPELVWFKHGDVGIGVARTQDKAFITVEPWRSDMPSLDLG